MKKNALVLVVDDDISMVEGLKDNLEFESYRVLSASTISDARKIIEKEPPDLLLLDVMLPDGDGFSLCRQLRNQGFSDPIVMLTARGEEYDKVLGLEVGADDYVVKPFSLKELLARVNAHLRRKFSTRVTPKQQVHNVGVASVDFDRHQLIRDGESIEISAKEMELLRYLVENRGHVLSRETLLLNVWLHQHDVVTRTVDNFIVRLRKKIEQDPAQPRYLLTVHGSGYKLVEQ